MKLADKVGASLGLPDVDPTAVGIELEYEFWNGDGAVMKYWTLEGDASLRNQGVEFVSRILPMADVPEALLEVRHEVERMEVQVNNRCGLHVHLNVRDLTWGQLWSLSTLYTLMEPSIFKRFAPDREWNHFCVPSFCNTLLLEHFVTDIAALRQGQAHAPNPLQAAERLRFILDDQAAIGRRRMRAPPPVHFEAGPELGIMGASKYCAMSFHRLHDLGTVEMRQVEGTLDMQVVREWVDFLDRMRIMALKFDDPRLIVDLYATTKLSGMSELLKLDEQDIDLIDQDDAEAASELMAGYDMPNWEELDWAVIEE